MNTFSVIARLGKDAELRALKNGTPVIQFNAAFDSGYGDRKVTTWMQCALFGKRASEKLASILLKGQQVGLTGEIKLDEWQGQDGTTNKSLKMMVNDLTLVGGQQAHPRQEPQPQAKQSSAVEQQSGTGGGMYSDFDDDIPFAPHMQWELA